MWKDVIANFEKQSKRIEKQNGTGESKSGKKGEFKAHAFKLITAGGGNKSALSCAGVTNNTGAAQMKNLTDFLDGCEDAIHVACNATNFDSIINTTKLIACKEVAETFKTGAEECMGKTVGAGKTSTADACACWTNTSLDATVQAAKDCKFSDEAKAVAAALKTCRNKFAECRRYEDDVADSIAACSTSSDALKNEVGLVSIIKKAQGPSTSLLLSFIISLSLSFQDASVELTASCPTTSVTNVAPSMNNMAATTEEATTTGSPTTTEALTATGAATTTEERTTTVAPTTTEALTTLAPITTEALTATGAATSTMALTATGAPSTTKERTTTGAATTMKASTTAGAATTTEALTTTGGAKVQPIYNYL